MSFAARLRDARLQAAFSQRDLADRVALRSGRQAINAYESGKVSPTLRMVEKMATALNVSAVWLAYGVK